jgi:hypothetical protein
MIRSPFFPRLTWAIRSQEAGSFPRCAFVLPDFLFIPFDNNGGAK